MGLGNKKRHGGKQGYRINGDKFKVFHETKSKGHRKVKGTSAKE